jgi:hypothetical protein
VHTFAQLHLDRLELGSHAIVFRPMKNEPHANADKEANWPPHRQEVRLVDPRPRCLTVKSALSQDAD